VYGWLIDPEYHYPEEYLSELDFYNIDERPRNITPCMSSLKTQIDAISKLVDYCINVTKNKHKLCKVDLCKIPKYHTADYCLECGKMVFVDREPVRGDIAQSHGQMCTVLDILFDHYNQKRCKIVLIDGKHTYPYYADIKYLKVIAIVLK